MSRTQNTQELLHAMNLTVQTVLFDKIIHFCRQKGTHIPSLPDAIPDKGG